MIGEARVDDGTYWKLGAQLRAQSTTSEDEHQPECDRKDNKPDDKRKWVGDYALLGRTEGETRANSQDHKQAQIERPSERVSIERARGTFDEIVVDAYGPGEGDALELDGSLRVLNHDHRVHNAKGPESLRGLSSVSDTGIEPATSSVSGKRATAAPIAHACMKLRVLEVKTGFEPV